MPSGAYIVPDCAKVTSRGSAYPSVTIRNDPVPVSTQFSNRSP